MIVQNKNKLALIVCFLNNNDFVYCSTNRQRKNGTFVFKHLPSNVWYSFHKNGYVRRNYINVEGVKMYPLNKRIDGSFSTLDEFNMSIEDCIIKYGHRMFKHAQLTHNNIVNFTNIERDELRDEIYQINLAPWIKRVIVKSTHILIYFKDKSVIELDRKGGFCGFKLEDTEYYNQNRKTLYYFGLGNIVLSIDN